ncbi:hypothetical protein REPUB_Repub05bG0023900 [Reevesia pubescens]
MESNGDDVARIRREIEALKDEKARIEQKISVLEAQLQETALLPLQLQQQKVDVCNGSCPPISVIDANLAHGLSADSIYRYSRHLLLPSFGVQAQSNLLKSSILVIGAGGLGSPALLYLAACGVGRLGIVDHDVVELNNMHRQVIHTEAYIGQPKVKSATAACHAINSTIQIVEHKEALRTSNALEIMGQYDIVIDATDNAPSRYMISDCCVVLGKPLVSGAALGLEGQLTVYNYKGGPCYRCLFPTPPPTTACQRCSDSGVLGVVPGIIGCLQALEAIKIASAVGEPLSGRMLLFDALSARIRISPPKLNLLAADSRITSEDYKARIVSGEAHILVDVRPEHHYRIVSIPKSLNIPLASLEARLPEISSALKEEQVHDGTGSGANLYVICRRGNDSQRAVQYLHDQGFKLAKDIVGGLESWSHDVDPNFPMY